VAQTSDSDSQGDNSQWRELLQPRYAASTVMLCLGVTLFAFTTFLVSTALPSAIAELGGAAYISWAQSLYLVFAIVSGVATSTLTRRFGSRLTLFIAVLVFLAGTLLCVFAPAMFVLLVGRSLQGFAAGFIEAQCYALIFVLFPQRLAPKVFGAEAVVWVTAGFAGPTLAGLVTEHVGWRAAFAISIPIALTFFALALRVVTQAETTKGSAFPGLRLGLIAAAMLLVTWASVATAGTATVMLIIACALTPLAVRMDWCAPHPMLPRSAFTLSGLHGLGFWVVVLMPVAEAASTVYLIYGLQNVFALKPTLAGLVGSIIAISWSVTQIAVSTYASESLRRNMVWIGAVLLVVGLGVAAIGFAAHSLVLVALSLIPVGMAFGMNWGNLSEVLIGASRSDERDRVATLLPTAQAAGFGIGAAVMGLIGNAAGFADAKSVADIQFVMVVVFSAGTIIALPAALAAYKVISAPR
jgi:MFS family permease